MPHTAKIERWAIPVTDAEGLEYFVSVLDDQRPGFWQTFYVTLFNSRGMAAERLRQVKEENPEKYANSPVVPVIVTIQEV